MWDSIVGAASAVGTAVGDAATAVTTGVVGTGEKVPFSCQVPFKKFEESMTGSDTFADFFHEECKALKNSPKWQPIDFTDPDGGDMLVFDQPQIGTYHLLKAVFTVKKAHHLEVLGVLTSGKKEVRAQLSTDLADIEIVAEKDDAQIVRIAYTAPPPAAGRDFVFLAGTKKADLKAEAWGCSVDIPSRPEEYEGYVRGACLYHWELMQTGDDTLCMYTSCFDPRGWAPPFIIGYFKSSATNEFRALRSICSKEPPKKKEEEGDDL